MKLPLKALIGASLLAFALFAGVGVAPATAATHKAPCWQVLLNDWYDGRIDGTYPIHCYRDALKHLPSDVEEYSSARDDILRALQSAREVARKEGETINGNTLITPANGKTSKTRKGHGLTVNIPTRKPPPGLANLADRLNPSSPSSVPLPLYILGGLALALVAAGGVGLGYRRLQTRRHGS